MVCFCLFYIQAHIFQYSIDITYKYYYTNMKLNQLLDVDKSYKKKYIYHQLTLLSISNRT